MDYSHTLHYLFHSLPAFERTGAEGYKPGLERVLHLSALAGNPHSSFRCIHVAGTNGKGSVSHLLAAVLQSAGYTVGLFTSPHLLDFAERIRVNGQPIDEQFVTRFVSQYRTETDRLKPTFFEITTVLAFSFFKARAVDIAVIETGMGGRLDSTNIISPILSIITNVSFDHTQYLGNTLTQIAAEKAGIIKPNTPVIVSETQEEALQVFENKAREMQSKLIVTPRQNEIREFKFLPNGEMLIQTQRFGNLQMQLSGEVQIYNAGAVLSAIAELQKADLEIPLPAVQQGFAGVCSLTGLKGRWQTLRAANPQIICDTAHNPAGIAAISRRLQNTVCNRVFLVIGFSADKDIDAMLALLPQEAYFVFTQAKSERALPCTTLQQKAARAGLEGKTAESVPQAVAMALSLAGDGDLIFIGGSNYTVAEALPLFT